MKQGNKKWVPLRIWIDSHIEGTLDVLSHNFTKEQIYHYTSVDKELAPDVWAGYLMGISDFLSILRDQLPLNALENIQIPLP